MEGKWCTHIFTRVTTDLRNLTLTPNLLGHARATRDITALETSSEGGEGGGEGAGRRGNGETQSRGWM